MKCKTVHEKYLEDEDFARLKAQEKLIMDVTENFCRILEEDKLNRSRLAQIMGKTKGYVSELLNGSREMTLRVLSDIAFSLGYAVKIEILTSKEFGRKSAERNYNLRDVDNEVNVKEQMPSIPEIDRREMERLGIRKPDAQQFWEGYNQYMRALYPRLKN